MMCVSVCVSRGQAYRLLAEEMYKKNWDYPLHLGVTGVCVGVCVAVTLA